MRTIIGARALFVLVVMQLAFAWLPAASRAQIESTEVELTITHFLYDLEADCTPGFNFTVPDQFAEVSMVQAGSTPAATRLYMRPSGSSAIDDPRRPRQSCAPFAIGPGLDRWQPLQDKKLIGRFNQWGGTVTVSIEMWDSDATGDSRLDLTQQSGSTVTFFIDPRNSGWSSSAVEPFCNRPVAGCTDNEGQWCGACNAAQACCDTNEPFVQRGYAFRGDGRGAGIAWTARLTRRECNARIDVDTDRDGLNDDWETSGRDRDCDGVAEVPLHLYGANPKHRDIFIEYDACAGQRISKQEITNLKAAFASAPFNATGFVNPDGTDGINVHVDTGLMTDPMADEGLSTCADGIDNDLDLRFDSADPDCVTGTQESAGTCKDGLDNDNDGTIDPPGGTCLGEDANGALIPKFEGKRGSCNDGKNNDNDMFSDAEDLDCRIAENMHRGGSVVTCPTTGIPNITTAFQDVKRANFATSRHDVFRYVVRWPKSGKQTTEDGVANGCGNGVDDSKNGVFDATELTCQLANEDGSIGLPGNCHNGKDDNGNKIPDEFEPGCHVMLEPPSSNEWSCFDGQDNGDGADNDDPECIRWGGVSNGDNIAMFEDDDGGGILMHELGHTLGLNHGGGDDVNRKPNYLSVMNYLYITGIPQDPDAMAEGLHELPESGTGTGNCADRIDNDGDGFIDSLDPNCRNSCRDGLDNDRDLKVDLLDPDCRGVDVENDGVADFLQIDYSPQRMQRGAARSGISPVLPEAVLFETEPFVTIDISPYDDRQDLWGDALNMVRFQRYLPGNTEGTGTCSDGVDNAPTNGAMDSFDYASCRAGMSALPRTGQRTLLPGGGVSVLPRGFDWNGDSFVSGFLQMELDEDPDPRTDVDSFTLLNDFDDWLHLHTRAVASTTAVSVFGIQQPYSVAQMIELTRASRPADLVLDSATTRAVPSASGAITFSVDVENIEPSEAYGPVTLTLSGLPTGATATVTGGRCWPQNDTTVCVRDRMKGYEIWTLTFNLQSELCSWRSTPLTLRVQHSGGVELNPEDNTLAIGVGGSGTWSQWRQCPSHWGASNYTGPSTLGAPTTVWSGSAILNTPVIDDAGDIYLADSGRNVRKIGPTGASRWTQPFSTVVRAGPALTPVGTLVVATEDGRVRGLSQATGMQLWSYQIPTNVLSSLVVAGDRLYAVTQFGLGLADSVFALDINGNFLWSRQLSGPLVSAPTVGADGTIYASVASGLFYSPAALTALSASGVVLWSKQLDGDARDTPVQRNGRVYVGTSTRRVYAFNAATGAQAWLYTTPCLTLEACEISGPPVALPGNQLAVGSAGGRVHVIRDNGTSATLVRSIAASGLFLGGPRDSMVVGSNNLAYVGNRNAQMRLLNLNTGTQVSLVAMQGNAVGSVALDGLGRFYIGTDAGRLYRY